MSTALSWVTAANYDPAARFHQVRNQRKVARPNAARQQLMGGASAAVPHRRRLGEAVTIRMPVTNTGPRRGAEVVQCYATPPPGRLFRPQIELKAFQKVWLEPGETRDVELTLDGRAFGCWDPGDPTRDDRLARMRVDVRHGGVEPVVGGAGWVVPAGNYSVRIGRSSADFDHILCVEVEAETPLGVS